LMESSTQLGKKWNQNLPTHISIFVLFKQEGINLHFHQFL
jgi:hypothetical protein